VTRRRTKARTKRRHPSEAIDGQAGQRRRQDPANAAEKTKAAFLEAFGHGAGYHQRFDPLAGAEPEVLGAVTLRRFAASGRTAGAMGCGWWFCAADADSVSWVELAKAVKCLLRAGIDPHGGDVARLGNEHARVSSWAAERDPYKVLRESLRSLRGKLPSISDAERLRKEWFTKVDALHRGTLGLKPLDSGRTNHARQSVIAAAKPKGWKPEHVAAALVLTGAEKLTADRDFKDIKGDMRKAYSRVSRR
jgi:hypothetical protein